MRARATVIDRAAGFARAFRVDRSAVAYVEFAYSLPIFMLLCMYGVELANIAITHARVSQIANMVADSAARVRDRIDEADINELMLGAKLAGDGIGLTEHGRIIVSTLEDNAATTTNLTDQVITWQRCKGVKASAAAYGAQGAVLTTGVGPVGKQISASPGTPIIFSEVIYDYQPIFSNRLFGAMTISYSSAYTVRDRVVQTMQNGGGLAGTSLATCNYFSI